MSNVEVSGNLTNAAVIDTSAVYPYWQVNLDITLIERYSETRQYFNYCKITNNSSVDINIKIGNMLTTIYAGDGFEWGIDVPIHFTGILIENLSAVTQVAIAEIRVEYAKVV